MRFAALDTALRAGAVRLLIALRFAGDLREDFRAGDFRAGDFLADDFFAGDLRAADFFRAGPLELDFRADFAALFFPRDALLRAGADLRPPDFFPPLFLPLFEPLRDDFLAAILPSSNVGVLLRHYSNFRAQTTTGVFDEQSASAAGARQSRVEILDKMIDAASPDERRRHGKRADERDGPLGIAPIGREKRPDCRRKIPG